MQVADQREFSLIADPVQTELVLLEGIVNQLLNAGKIEFLTRTLVAHAVHDGAHTLIGGVIDKAVIDANLDVLRRVVQRHPGARQGGHSGAVLDGVFEELRGHHDRGRALIFVEVCEGRIDLLADTADVLPDDGDLDFQALIFGRSGGGDPGSMIDS